MAGLDLTAANAILKEFYLPTIRDQLNSQTVLLSEFERNEEDVESDVSGNYAVIPLRKGRNQGIGFRSEGGTLPTAGSQGYAAARVSMAYDYGRIKVYGSD